MKSINRLLVAKKRYDTALESVESELNDKIKFPFFITYHESDGFCVVECNSTDTMVLSTAIEIIKRNKVLSFKDLKENVI